MTTEIFDRRACRRTSISENQVLGFGRMLPLISKANLVNRPHRWTVVQPTGQ